MQVAQSDITCHVILEVTGLNHFPLINAEAIEYLRQRSNWPLDTKWPLYFSLAQQRRLLGNEPRRLVKISRSLSPSLSLSCQASGYLFAKVMLTRDLGKEVEL